MMSTSRLLISAAGAAFLGAYASAPAQASTVTFNLALTSLPGLESGTGSLTVNGPVGNQTFTSSSGGLVSLNIFIDGLDFTLGNAQQGATRAKFSNGNFESLSYVGILGGDTLTIGANGFAFIDTNPLRSSVGRVSDPPVSATPLPTTWTMMLIGLAGFGVVLYRRKGRDTFAGGGSRVTRFSDIIFSH
jgi:hypothetical protein